jgi:hypothetical protein
MIVPERPRMEPDALATVIAESEKPISNKYVIRVAE